MVIRKYTEVFRRFFSASGREGWVGGYVGGSVHEGSFHGGREIAMKGAPDLPALFIGYCEVYNHFQEGFFLEGGARGGGYSGESFRGGCFFGVRDISMKGAPDFQALFKKRSEIK